MCMHSCIINVYTLQTNDACVKFAPSQYITIYYSRLHHPLIRKDGSLNAMCLLQMRALNWQNAIITTSSAKNDKSMISAKGS